MRLITVLSLLLLFVACSPQPRPIEYGTDLCDFCRMTIIDKQHAAELVTDKGRVYKFDAIECQVLYLQEHQDVDFSYFLVTDYASTEGGLLAADSCTYLISPNLSSPMGANLTAFADHEIAQQFQFEKTGELYDWSSLQAQFEK